MSQPSPQFNTPNLGNFGADPLGPPAPHHHPSNSQTPSASLPQSPNPSEHQQTQAASVDPELVDKTKNQIRILVDEIQNLARTNLTVGEFMDGFTPRIANALASAGAAIWLVDPESANLALKHYVNVPPVLKLTEQTAAIEHLRLLKKNTGYSAGCARTSRFGSLRRPPNRKSNRPPLDLTTTKNRQNYCWPNRNISTTRRGSHDPARAI